MKRILSHLKLEFTQTKYSLLERQTDWLEVFENKQPDLVD